MKITDIAMLKKMLGGGAGNGGGGVSSWNDLTDKPFYSTVGEILPETTVELNDSQGMFPVDFLFYAGSTYIVTYNGVEYSLVAMDFPEYPGAAFIGNGEFLGLDGDYGLVPFAIVTVEDGVQMCLVMDILGNPTATFSIQGETVKQIDAKYVPGLTIPRISVNWINQSTLFNLRDYPTVGVLDKALLGGLIDVDVIESWVSGPNSYEEHILVRCTISEYSNSNGDIVYAITGTLHSARDGGVYVLAWRCCPDNPNYDRNAMRYLSS